MRKDIRNIYQAFAGKLVGTQFMKKCVCETLALMPPKIITYITSNCWFISSLTDAWAFAFTGNDLKDQHLIFLSEHLLTQDIAQIHYSIAHEIGHVVLGHRNSVLERQTKQEIRTQESQADSFASDYLPSHGLIS